MSLRTGTGRRDVTPDGPVFLAGYPHVARWSTGVHDPLTVTALWLENDGSAVVLVSVDALFVPHDTARACRAAIAAATGIEESAVLVGATKTLTVPRRACRSAWARLIAKVYEVDPLICPRCGSGNQSFRSRYDSAPPHQDW